MSVEESLDDNSDFGCTHFSFRLTMGPKKSVSTPQTERTTDGVPTPARENPTRRYTRDRPSERTVHDGSYSRPVCVKQAK